MFTLKIENEFNAEKELTHNDSYKVTSITGLNPPGAAITTSTIAGFDGERYNSSRMEKRNVVITIVINDNVAETLNEFNRLILPKRYLKTSYKTKEKNVYIEGYVESFEYDHFSNKVKCQISIICPSPYWIAQESEEKAMSPVVDLLEFPFSIPREGIAFCEKIGAKTEYVENNGTIETGAIIEINVTKKVENPLIENATTGQQMKLNIELYEDDHIAINTERGKKSIMLERNGTKSNILNSLTNASEWIQIMPGYNRFNYNADSGVDGMRLNIKYSTLYGGV